MNTLNSLILEGKTSKEKGYHFIDNEEQTMAQFNIECQRVCRNKGEEVQEVYNFPCRAYGNIAKVLDSKLKKEIGIRVVGLLKEIKGAIWVYVEHVEFKKTK